MEPKIEKFIWDLSYACPLRCTHCYSESGRRAAETPPPEQLLRIAEVIARVKPQRISLSGGEPLIVPGWEPAAKRLRDAGIDVSLYTSGWVMNEDTAHQLARSVNTVVVSIDGAVEETHDRFRQKDGSFRRALAALEILARVKRERAMRGEEHFTLGIDFTVVRSNLAELERATEELSRNYPGLDFLRFGMGIPVGLAQEESYVESELLTMEQGLELLAAEKQLAARASNGVRVSVTDVRHFLYYTPHGEGSAGIAHLHPDGQLRAFAIYEAKIGNVLEESFDVLWRRAEEWRRDPFVVALLSSITTIEGWGRVTRTLDRRFGSSADKERIALRGQAQPPPQKGAPGPQA